MITLRLVVRSGGDTVVAGVVKLPLSSLAKKPRVFVILDGVVIKEAAGI